MLISFLRDCDYSFKQACHQSLLKREVRIVSSKITKHLTRSHYADNAYGWENFLLPNGPGLKLMQTGTKPPSSLQFLPSVGMRICADLGRDEDDYIYAARVCSWG